MRLGGVLKNLFVVVGDARRSARGEKPKEKGKGKGIEKMLSSSYYTAPGLTVATMRSSSPRVTRRRWMVVGRWKSLQ